MIIPNGLLVKAKNDALKIKTQRIVEVSWDYLCEQFKDEKDYLGFLSGLSVKKYEDFLYTMFFYWAHDLYRIVKEEEVSNIDGFMYQITLSMTEYLSDGEYPKEKISNFTKHFSSDICKEINKKIIAHPLNKKEVLNLEFWEILYDMRNDFVHEAQWFDMPDQKSKAKAFLSLTKHRIYNSQNPKKYIVYAVEAKIKFQEYLKFFWQAYLDYFGYKKPI